MKNKNPIKNYPVYLKSFIYIIIIWTVFNSSLLIWTIKLEKDTKTSLILTQARSFLKQIVITRFWNAQHGGVYVPVTDKTQPNPYLDIDNRDIITKDGIKMTLINPAFMTRQLSEIASTRDQVQFHITSLNPIRPANAPEDWEKQALNRFKEKGDEYFFWDVKEEKPFNKKGIQRTYKIN